MANKARIKDLSRLKKTSDFLGKIIEVESADGTDQNHSAGVPLLIQAIAENLPAPQKVTQIIVRTYDATDSNYNAGFPATLVSESLTRDLVLWMKAYVEFPYPSVEYRLVPNAAGPYMAYLDTTYTGNKLPCKWAEVGSADDQASAFTNFSPLTEKYVAGNTVKYTLNGQLRLFSARVDLVRSSFPTNLQPTPTGLGTDAYWQEINAAQPTQLIDWLPASYKKDAVVVYQGILYRATTDLAYNQAALNPSASTDWETIGGNGLAQWAAGAQRANTIVYYKGNLYLVKSDIANGQTPPAGNTQYYTPLLPANAKLVSVSLDAVDNVVYFNLSDNTQVVWYLSELREYFRGINVFNEETELTGAPNTPIGQYDPLYLALAKLQKQISSNVTTGDTNYVHKIGNEAIAGKKTFTDDLRADFGKSIQIGDSGGTYVTTLHGDDQVFYIHGEQEANGDEAYTVGFDQFSLRLPSFGYGISWLEYTNGLETSVKLTLGRPNGVPTLLLNGVAVGGGTVDTSGLAKLHEANTFTTTQVVADAQGSYVGISSTEIGASSAEGTSSLTASGFSYNSSDGGGGLARDGNISTLYAQDDGGNAVSLVLDPSSQTIDATATEHFKVNAGTEDDDAVNLGQLHDALASAGGSGAAYDDTAVKARLGATTAADPAAALSVVNAVSNQTMFAYINLTASDVENYVTASYFGSLYELSFAAQIANESRLKVYLPDVTAANVKSSIAVRLLPSQVGKKVEVYGRPASTAATDKVLLATLNAGDSAVFSVLRTYGNSYIGYGVTAQATYSAPNGTTTPTSTAVQCTINSGGSAQQITNGSSAPQVILKNVLAGSTAGMANTTTSSITIPTTGWYNVSIFADMSQADTSQRYELSTRINGQRNEKCLVTSAVGASDGRAMGSITRSFYLTAGDKVTMLVYSPDTNFYVSADPNYPDLWATLSVFSR